MSLLFCKYQPQVYFRQRKLSHNHFVQKKTTVKTTNSNFGEIV